MNTQTAEEIGLSNEDARCLCETLLGARIDFAVYTARVEEGDDPSARLVAINWVEDGVRLDEVLGDAGFKVADGWTDDQSRRFVAKIV